MKKLNISKRITKKKDNEKSNNLKVFGVPFDRTSNTIPVVIKRVVEFFDVNGVEIEGLFRISGAFSDVNKLKQEFDDGKNPELLGIEDPHVCAALLKQYLRELPEPLLTFELYDCFLASASVPEEALADKIKSVLTMLPLSHRIILKYLISFLHRVSLSSEINKMTPSNIAIVFAPNLLKPDSDDIATQITDTPYSNKLMELFVQQYTIIFKDEPDEPNGALKTTSPPSSNNNNNNITDQLTNELNNQLSSAQSKPLPRPPADNNKLIDVNKNANNNNNINSFENIMNNPNVNNSETTKARRSAPQRQNATSALPNNNNNITPNASPTNSPIQSNHHNHINNNNNNNHINNNNNLQNPIARTNSPKNNALSKSLPPKPPTNPGSPKQTPNNISNKTTTKTNNNISNLPNDELHLNTSNVNNAETTKARRAAPQRQNDAKPETRTFTAAPGITATPRPNTPSQSQTPPVPPRSRSNTAQRPSLTSSAPPIRSKPLNEIQISF